MIATWMLYCLAVGALLTLGALAMERGMRAARLPQRWGWAAAMALCLALPAAARWMPDAPEPVPAASAAMEAGAPGSPAPSADVPPAVRWPAIDLAALDRPLAIGWMVMSGICAAALLGAGLLLARRRRRWTRMEIDGVPVLLSADTGPAVIGLFRSRIVLPAWVLDADATERALLVEHEREHVRAGDPRLLAFGLLCVVLMPWNPLTWLQLRRLRLALEMDCDARVLARRADVRAYGTLLLNVGRRASAAPRLIAAAAFSEPASFLERRIRMMTSPRPRRPLLRAVVSGAAALLLVAAACRAPEPSSAPAAQPSDGTTDPVALEIQPRQAIDRYYPQVRQGLGDSVTVVLFYSSEGKLVDRRLTVRGQQPADVPSPLAMRPGRLGMQKFAAGELGPDAVRVFTMRQLTQQELAASASRPQDTVVTTTTTTARATGARTDTVVITTTVPTSGGVTTTAPTTAVPTTAVPTLPVPVTPRVTAPARTR
ncbi:M56 family metallopeptidase [Longimicrobium sp.]|uniref:M56 family metallopeptidase n=1 Tax=Longimicrobium sp. TaxID=2029185 RepID=UPI002E2ECC1C|nr:M56 family metallopeptidase [Longimicrobium sp.]HEX6042554.1 M56 family metallopeptidase [Longimicrobium sp.]